MKRIILIFIVASTMLTAFSQTEKGKKSIGGSVRFLNDLNNSSSISTPAYDSKYLNLSVLPKYGWFIKDNLEVGINLNIGYLNYSTDYKDSGYSNNSEDRTYTYGLGFFAKKYYTVGDKLKFFINGSLAYDYLIIENNQITTNSLSVNSQTMSNVFMIDITPGLVYFVTPKLGLEASFGQINYSFSNSTQKNDPSFKGSNNKFGINLNASSLYFGLKYYY